MSDSRLQFIESDEVATPSINQILYTNQAEMVLIDLVESKGQLINIEA